MAVTRKVPKVSEACLRGDEALAKAFSFLGKRWNAMILAIVGAGPIGFRDLSRTIGGISDSVLSDRLAELTRAGLLSRSVEQGPPVSVSYELTPVGLALMPALEQIAQWSHRHLS
ncbi:winged helix-turn-helix transcriptional regulator [Virgisporangium ochraceum]|uniref:winged helix-turn-helix transcriptional regulator n=1 Tax=Virgisporangium ochraceum TaxID=65505 RepID=UPI001EF1CBCA|nr:helix-turn-helix domain-containing protein [Virgisporangium ochraceum]